MILGRLAREEFTAWVTVELLGKMEDFEKFGGGENLLSALRKFTLSVGLSAITAYLR